MPAEFPVGVVHGRFQGLHVEHLRYLLDAKKRCEFLVVGLANPDPALTPAHAADPQRTRVSANPFTYYERFLMTRDCLLEAGVDWREFGIVPFPINRPELLQYYVPMDAVFLMNVGDQWDRAKRELFESLGLAVHVMWEGAYAPDRPSGTEVRRRIVAGERLDDLVPAATARFIHTNGLSSRVARLIAEESAAK